MNSHRSDLVDELFTQALEPLSHAAPPRDAVRKFTRRFIGLPPSVNRFMTWVHSFSAQYFMLSNQPYFTGPYGKYRPSPFLSVMVSQLSGYRLAS